MAATDSSLPGLLTPSLAYKPFRYPWAYDFWKKQQQVHWMPEEVPLGEDCKDWAVKLSDAERNLLTQIFRFFTQSDVEVGANYMEHYMPLFKPVEVSMMLSSFSNMETIHIAAYALLLETIGMPDSEFSAFMEYKEMAAKHDYLGQFDTKTNEDIAHIDSNGRVLAGLAAADLDDDLLLLQSDDLLHAPQPALRPPPPITRAA